MKHLLYIALMLAPAIAGAQADSIIPDESHADPSTYEIDANRVILSHRDSAQTDVVVVTEAGDLTVNGNWVTTDDDDRKLLRQAFVEFVKLDEMNEKFTADIKLIVANTEAEADYQSTEEFEQQLYQAVGSIEGSAKKLEKQAAKVSQLGLKIRTRIPALADFNWSLDD